MSGVLIILYTFYSDQDFKLTVIILASIVYIKIEYADTAITKSFNIFKKSVEDSFQTYVFISKIEVLCLIVVLAFVYFFVCRQFLKTLRDVVWTTQGITSLIPTTILLENLRLRKIILKEKF